MGPEDLGGMYSDVEDAWNNLRMDHVLLKQGNLSMKEGVLVCHFLELAVRRGTYAAQSVAVVTTHYAKIKKNRKVLVVQNRCESCQCT